MINIKSLLNKGVIIFMIFFGWFKRFLVRLDLSLRFKVYKREKKVSFVVLNLDANRYSKIGAMEALDKNNYEMEHVKRDNSRRIVNVLYSPRGAYVRDRKKAVSIFFNDTMLPSDQVLTIYSWIKKD